MYLGPVGQPAASRGSASVWRNTSYKWDILHWRDMTIAYVHAVAFLQISVLSGGANALSVEAGGRS